ncbi:unnamed protein product [Merluccius merluccius]
MEAEARRVSAWRSASKLSPRQFGLLHERIGQRGPQRRAVTRVASGRQLGPVPPARPTGQEKVEEEEVEVVEEEEEEEVEEEEVEEEVEEEEVNDDDDSKCNSGGGGGGCSLFLLPAPQCVTKLESRGLRRSAQNPISRRAEVETGRDEMLISL